MKHIHAENMLAYAQDAMETGNPWERWEYLYLGNFIGCTDHPRWDTDREYRRKPRTININGHEVPEPAREPLKRFQQYYTVDTWNDKIVDEYSWNDDEADKRLLKRGIIHLTREAAEAHAKALLSFTEKQQ